MRFFSDRLEIKRRILGLPGYEAVENYDPVSNVFNGWMVREKGSQAPFRDATNLFGVTAVEIRDHLNKGQTDKAETALKKAKRCEAVENYRSEPLYWQQQPLP